MTPEIIPAILTDSPELLQRQIAEAGLFAQRVQIDFALPPFIDPQTTIAPNDMPRVRFPGILEAHVMAEDPASHFPALYRAGCDMVYFHWEAARDHAAVVRFARMLGLKVGLALNPGTSWRKVPRTLVRELDAVLFMTVVPGKQGNPFQKRVVKAISAFRKRFPSIRIAVDGGITTETIGIVQEAGADFIAVGSFLWMHPDGPRAAYRALYAAVKDGGEGL